MFAGARGPRRESGEAPGPHPLGKCGKTDRPALGQEGSGTRGSRAPLGRVYIGATAGQAAVTPVYQLRLQEQFSRVCAHGADARVRIPTSTGRTQGVRNTGEHTGPTCLPRGLRVTQAASRQKGSSWIPSPRTSPSQTVGRPAAGHKRREGEKREEHSRIKAMTDAETR